MIQQLEIFVLLLISLKKTKRNSGIGITINSE